MNKEKPSYCKNCGYQYDEIAPNYCPSCGQKSYERVTISNILEGLMSSYFSLDSRLYQTIVPFLLQPGKVAKDYIDGKRKTYMGPSQLYFFFSFLFLLTGTSLYVKNWDKQLNNLLTSSLSSESFLLSGDIKNSDPKYLVDSLGIQDFVNVDIPEQTDSTNQIDLSGIVLSQKELREYQILIDAGKTNQEIYKSKVKPENQNLYNRITYYWFYNLLRNKGKGLVLSLFSQLAVGFVVALILFTLLLKLFYIRKKISFAEHFVHTVYFFSFFLFLLTYGMIGFYGMPGFLWPAMVIIASLLYLLISMKKVYQQGKIKTILKFTLFVFSSSVIITFTVIVVIFLLSMVQYS